MRRYCREVYAKFLTIVLIPSEKKAVVPTTCLCLEVIFSWKFLFLPVFFLRVRQSAAWIAAGLQQTPRLLFFPWCYILRAKIHLRAGTFVHLEHSPGPWWPQLQGWQDRCSSRGSNFFLSTVTQSAQSLFLAPLKQCCSLLEILAYVMEYVITWGVGPGPWITSLLEDKPCASHFLLQTTWC